MPHINSELLSTRLILPARQWINDHSNHYLERLQDNFHRRALTAHNSAEQAHSPEDWINHSKKQLAEKSLSSQQRALTELRLQRLL
jgi:hypothetical protein